MLVGRGDVQEDEELFGIGERRHWLDGERRTCWLLGLEERDE